MEIFLDYKPHPKQNLIHKYGADPNIFFTTICAGRQSGKSLAMSVESFLRAAAEPNQLIGYVSYTEKQVQKCYEDLKNVIQSSGVIKKTLNSKGTIRIELLNGSKIYYKSIKAGDSLRGFTFDYLFCDETAYFDKDVFWKVLFPTLAAKGKGLIAATTPKGKNFFYENLWLKGINPEEKRHKAIRFTSFDNPHISNDFLDEYKTLPPEMYQQEVMAEFVDSASTFKRVNDCVSDTLIQAPVLGNGYYIGCDIGFNDYTVITVIDSNGDCVYIDRFIPATSVEIREKIKHVNEIFLPQTILIESNNAGKPIIDELQYEGINNVEGFITSMTSKPLLINELSYAFAKGTIKIPKLDWLINELELYSYTLTSSANIKFESPVHDDGVMSLAIAWRCYKDNCFAGVPFFR